MDEEQIYATKIIPYIKKYNKKHPVKGMVERTEWFQFHYKVTGVTYKDDYYSWNKPGGAGGAGGTVGGGVGNSGAGSSGGGGGGARGGNIYSPQNTNYGFNGGGAGGAAQIKVYVKG
jgi:hypothetical protein